MSGGQPDPPQQRGMQNPGGVKPGPSMQLSPLSQSLPVVHAEPTGRERVGTQPVVSAPVSGSAATT